MNPKPWILNRYDPEEAERVYSMRTLDVWRRDMEISVPFTAFLGKVRNPTRCRVWENAVPEYPWFEVYMGGYHD